jgi:GNAT superfamily N-acetyltransferase
MIPGVDIRRADRDADCEGIALVVNAVESEPVTPAEVGQWFDHEHPGKRSFRRVAVDAAGAVVGYSVAVHEAWRPDGDWFAWIAVLPGWRRRGIGSALAAGVVGFLADESAVLARTDIREASPDGVEFALDRGFRVVRRVFESVLDLESFDESPFASCRSRLESGGFSFLSMSDLPDTTESRRCVYELNRIVCLEIPGEEEDAAISFEEWEDLLLGAPWFRADGQLLCEFDSRLVGLAAVQVFPEKREAYNLVTGVVPELRRRGVATALKLEAARYAVRCGAVTLRANNDSVNDAMIAINRRFGYSPEPGRLVMHRPGSG